MSTELIVFVSGNRTYAETIKEIRIGWSKKGHLPRIKEIRYRLAGSQDIFTGTAVQTLGGEWQVNGPGAWMADDVSWDL